MLKINYPLAKTEIRKLEQAYLAVFDIAAINIDLKGLFKRNLKEFHTRIFRRIAADRFHCVRRGRDGV